jgi:phosphoglycolate phosphatase-like HAD superfamily hydrolase
MDGPDEGGRLPAQIAVFLMKFKAIILDFDGTIVESVGIKDRAFRELFKDYPDRLDEIMAYHLSHNATVRFEKFWHITENILKKEYTEDIARDLRDRFSKLIFQRIVECPYVPGAEDFLDYFQGKVPLFLISISPAEEFERILSARNLTKYFKRIYAVPWIKADAIKDILQNESVFPQEAVFIGDSFEDYQSAQSTRVFFIGRDSGKSFGGADIPVYRNLDDIKNYLDTPSCRQPIDDGQKLAT